MKIASIEAIPVRIPLTAERRMISALGRHEVSQFVVVRLTTDTGIVGAGEATATPRWSGETVWGAQAIIQNLFAPLLQTGRPVCHSGLTPHRRPAYIPVRLRTFAPRVAVSPVPQRT